MNCQDISTLLDERDISGLEADERARVDAHLQNCADCAGDWEAHERMLAAAIPAVPAALAERCRALAPATPPAGAVAPQATADGGTARTHPAGTLAASTYASGTHASRTQDSGARRRERTRPQAATRRGVVVGSLLLVGAAAAAVVGVNWIAERPSGEEGGIVADGAVVSATAPAVSNAAYDGPGASAPPGDPPLTRSAPVPAPASMTVGVATGAEGAVTVGIQPLVQDSTSAEVVAVTEAIYAALLDQLRALPNLELVVLDAPLPQAERLFNGPSKLPFGGPSIVPLSTSTRFAPPDSQNATAVGSASRVQDVAGGSSSGPSVDQLLTLVRSGPEPGTAVPPASPGSGPIQVFALEREAVPVSSEGGAAASTAGGVAPAATSAASTDSQGAAGPAAVTGIFSAAPGPGAPGTAAIGINVIAGAAAGASTGPADFEWQGDAVGVGTSVSASSFNVVLEPQVAISLVDARIGADNAAVEAAAPDFPYDYVLNVSSRAGGAQGSTQAETFSFVIQGARSGVAGNTTLMLGGRVFDRVDAAEYAKQAVDQLRQNLFEPDTSLVDEISAIVVDASAPRQKRIQKLGQLAELARRFGLEGRRGAVVAAAVDLAASATSAGERTVIWQLMQGAGDPTLIQPLANALLYDADEGVRIAAASALAGFADDPSARAALEFAAGADASSEVRRQARWLSLDESGRQDYVNGALLDASLTDAERVAPLDLAEQSAIAQLVSVGRRPVAAQSAVAINGPAASALVGIVRGTEDPGRRATLLRYLGSVDQPDVNALLLDSLARDPFEGVRVGAAVVLRQRLDDPGVRAALEAAQASDASPVVRRMAGIALQPQPVATESQFPRPGQAGSRSP